MDDSKEDRGEYWPPNGPVKLSAVQQEVLKKLPLRTWVNARMMGCRTMTLIRLYTSGQVRMRNRKSAPGEPTVRRPKGVVDLEFFRPDI